MADDQDKEFRSMSVMSQTKNWFLNRHNSSTKGTEMKTPLSPRRFAARRDQAFSLASTCITTVCQRTTTSAGPSLGRTTKRKTRLLLGYKMPVITLAFREST